MAFLSFLLLGMLMVFHVQLASSLRLSQASPGDPRLIGYLLEHTHRWALQQYPHLAFWDLPMFYPAENTGAYSDTFFGLLPFYSPWRLLGVPPDTSFQLFGMALSVANYVAGWFLLRRGFGFGPVASGLGAFFFSFSAMRAGRIGQTHLMGMFLVPAVLGGLLYVFGTSDRRRAGWAVVGVCLAIAWQFHAAFYIGYFLVLLLAIALAAGLIRLRWRRTVIERLQRDAAWWFAGGMLAAAALAPLAIHYLAAMDVLGPRPYEKIELMQPRWWSWFHLGPYSWVYSPLYATELGQRALGPLEWERRLGLGLVTSGIALYGLWRWRRNTTVQVIVIATAVLAFAATRWGTWSLWPAVYWTIPGAGAIRAVARVGLFCLIPAGIGIAAAWEGSPRRRWLLVPLFAFAIAEQGITAPSFDKLEYRRRHAQLASAVPKSCEVLYYSPLRRERSGILGQLDGIWAAEFVNLPSVNGYSGSLPPNWAPLYDNARIDTLTREATLRRDLHRWLATTGAEDVALCWLKGDLGDLSIELMRSPVAAQTFPQEDLEPNALSEPPSNVQPPRGGGRAVRPAEVAFASAR